MTKITLKQRARGFWHKLTHLDARPDQIAASFSIGIVASFLPLNPSPIIVATGVAWLLKRNVIAAVAGATAAILYTPLLPVIWLAEYQLGKLILPVQHPLMLDHARLWDVLQKGWDVYAAMLVGSIIIATPVTVLTYFVVKQLAERWARQKKKAAMFRLMAASGPAIANGSDASRVLPR
ncbi:MAG: DUF2062 domain-containing protein [Verrucomicrobiia bacterium]|jgi:uncharacterized protein (DUF2062 family)